MNRRGFLKTAFVALGSLPIINLLPPKPKAEDIKIAATMSFSEDDYHPLKKVRVNKRVLRGDIVVLNKNGSVSPLKTVEQPWFGLAESSGKKGEWITVRIQGITL